MPVSGNEETGLMPDSRMAGNYSADVPIKKRKFPTVRLPSPTPEEQSSVPLENESVQKEDSSLSQGSALPNASIPASSSALSDANKDSLHEKVKGNTDGMNIKMTHNIASSFRAKIEEPSTTAVHPALGGDIVSNEQLGAAVKIAKTELNLSTSGASTLDQGKDVSSTKIAKLELDLSPIGTPARNLGNDVSSERQVVGKTDLEPSKTSAITDLSLGINEHLFLSMAGKDGDRSCQNKVKGEPILFNLSSSKGESGNQCENNDFELHTGGVNMCTNRSYWDLNTTMDAWDGRTVDQVSGQVAEDGFSTITGTCDVKPLISSIGKIGGDIALGKQFLEGNVSRSSAATLPDLPTSHCNSDDSLHLGLSSSSLLSNLNEKPSGTSAPLSLGGNIVDLSLRKAFVLTGNLDQVNIKSVKSEPLDESTKLDFKSTTTVHKEILGLRPVKSELADRCNPEALRSSTSSTLKVVDSRSIKPEPVHEGIQGTLKKIEGTSNHSGKMMLNGQNMIGKTHDLSVSVDVSNSFEHPLSIKTSQFSEEVPADKAERARLLARDAMSASVGHDRNEANVSGMGDTTTAEDKNVDDLEQRKLIFMDATPAPSDSMGNVEDSASGDEKINLSGDMIEEDSFGIDYESDGNHDLGTAMDTKQDEIREEDVEDGEVRKAVADTTMEEPDCERREVGPFNSGDSLEEQLGFVGLPTDVHPTSSDAEDKDCKTEKSGERNYNNVEKCSETARDEKTNECRDDKSVILQESAAVETPTCGAGDCSKGKETEQSSDQAPGSNQGNSSIVVQSLDEDVKNSDVIDKNISALPKLDTFLNVDEASKDASCGGQKSRIINLRASNLSFPDKTRTISARSMPTRGGKVPDVELEGGRFCPRRRDEILTGGSHKFSRDRYQDQSSKNSRLNFVRGRGKFSSRIDTLHGDWDSDQNFAPEYYNAPAQFSVPRHKYASQTDLEFNRYNIGLNGAFPSTGRGKKPLNDEAPVYHLPSRRQFLRRRVGPPRRGLDGDMVRRIPRNINPNRCISEGDLEPVGLRDGEEFMRGLPNDNSNPIYKHPQAFYEGLDSQSVGGNKNFSSIQTRGFHENHSKSPIVSKIRAPATWSPKGRSPDGFGGHSELPNQRSAPIFRMERMRSPDQSCFPPEIVVGRHSSRYMSTQSNELREFDPGQDGGHSRSVIPNRSPSCRGLFRNSRRLDMNSDDFYDRPMRSGQYQELGADGPNDDRRFSERQGPARPFRPPFSSFEGENFHLNPENGPAPFRFRPEDDSDFHNRESLREREFDRRVKNLPGNTPPRRTGNIEGREGNFRHQGKIWHDEGFDDMSRIKRKRF